MRVIFTALAGIAIVITGLVLSLSYAGDSGARNPHKPTTSTQVQTTATPSCYTASDGVKEVNVGSQFGYTDSAIRSAISVAQKNGCRVWFQAGTYHYSNVLTDNGLKFWGAGTSSLLVADSKPNMAIKLTGNGAQLKGIKINCPQCELPSGPPTSARLSTPESAGVYLSNATNFLVDNVTVERAGSAGMISLGSSFGKITNSHVNNTLADGIHLTKGSNNIEVAGNTTSNVGDDMIAVVSYLSDGVQSHDINIHNNTVNGQPWGRGISVVGGNHVQIVSNSISNTYGAGIYAEAEGGTFNTYGDDTITISSNTIRNPARVIHNTNILVGTYNTTQVTKNVTGTNNNLDRAKPGLVTQGNFSGVNVGWFYGN